MGLAVRPLDKIPQRREPNVKPTIIPINILGSSSIIFLLNSQRGLNQFYLVEVLVIFLLLK